MRYATPRDRCSSFAGAGRESSPPEASRPYRFSYQYGFRRRPASRTLVVWTNPVTVPRRKGPGGGRCCASSLYTFAARGSVSICKGERMRQRHVTRCSEELEYPSNASEPKRADGLRWARTIPNRRGSTLYRASRTSHVPGRYDPAAGQRPRGRPVLGCSGDGTPRRLCDVPPSGRASKSIIR